MHRSPFETNPTQKVNLTVHFIPRFIAPHFVIFSTRVPGYWYQNVPSLIFSACIIGTQIVALLFSVYGVFGEGKVIRRIHGQNPKNAKSLKTNVSKFVAEEVAGCGWAWGMGVLGISLVYFMFLDVVKVWIFRAWSFELTAKLWPSPARKRALADRQAGTKRLEATTTSWHKVAKIVEMHQVAAAFSSQ